MREKRGKNWYYRTVKNGKVKILNKYYAPRPHNPESEGSQEYDGRFEGLRLLFGVYWSPSDSIGWHTLDFVYMWGTEEYARLSTEEYDNPQNKIVIREKKLTQVDGYIPWCIWKEVNDEGVE